MTRIELLLVVLTCLILGSMQISALKCYVCKGCELNYNETHLTTCEAEEGEEANLRCIKRDMIDGEIERDCGTLDVCKVGSEDDKKPRRTGSQAYTNRGGKPRRFVRQLLQTNIKKDDNANVTTEFTALSCCKEDECNGAFSLFTSIKSTMAIPFFTTIYSFICGFLNIQLHNFFTS